MGSEQSVITADHDDAALVDDTMNGIAIKGASQHSSPNLGSSQHARTTSDGSFRDHDEAGDFNIRGAAAAQGGDLSIRSPRTVVYPEPRMRGPLKRSHNDTQSSEDRRDQRPKRDRSVERTQSRDGDRDRLQTTRQLLRRSRSPERLGKTFHRERSPPRGPRVFTSGYRHGPDEHWSPHGWTDDHAVDHWNARAERRSGLEQTRRPSLRDADGGIWPSSSPRRQRSDPFSGPRPSPIFRSSSNVSPSGGRPAAREQRSDFVQRAYYPIGEDSDKRDPKTGPQSNQDERQASSRIPAGLENAPTGPRYSAARVPSARHTDRLPDVSPGVLGSPHAFIPKSVMPINQELRKDLLSFMRSFKPMGLHFDQHGYYVTFKNDPAGHEDLQACVTKKQDSLFHRQYSLTLTPFPEGQLEPRRGPVAAAQDSRTEQGSQRRRQLTQSHQSNSIPSLQASAPHGGGRIAQDDVSSIGGRSSASSVTRSQNMCHVCNEPSSSVRPTEILCSSCPRKYHRMCTKNPPSSRDETTWRCNRCVKKHIQAPIRDDSNEIETEEIQASKMVLACSAVSVSGQSAEITGAPAPKGPLSIQHPSIDRHLDLQAPMPEAALSPAHAMDDTNDEATSRPGFAKPTGPALLHGQDMHYDEADDLVQQSFAGLTNASDVTRDDGQKPKRPLFIRKKAGKPAQNKNLSSITNTSDRTETEDRQPQPQERSVSSISRSSHQLRDTLGVSAGPRMDHDSLVHSTADISEGPPAAVSSISSRHLSESLQEPTTSVTGECGTEAPLPEIPESPTEPRGNDHQTRIDPSTPAGNVDVPTRVKPTFGIVRKTKFQDRTCNACGTVVSTKSSIALFRCLSCQKADQTQSPAPVAIAQPSDGSRADPAVTTRASQEQATPLVAHETEVTGKQVVEQSVEKDVLEQRADQRLTPTTFAQALGKLAAVPDQTVAAPDIGSHRQKASPALSQATGSSSGKPARRGRGKQNVYSYHRMIGMALCERGSLQVKGIAAWILENVPGMDGAVEKSSMLGNISGTVSLNLDRRGKQLFRYQPWKAGDSTEFGMGTWVELQPDKFEKHERWDPVLKEPISPLQVGKKQSTTTRLALDASRTTPKLSPVMFAAPTPCKQNNGAVHNPGADMPPLPHTNDESSDEEPLSKIRPLMKRVVSAPIATMLGSSDADKMDIDIAPKPARKMAIVPPMPATESGSNSGNLRKPQRPSQLSSRKASPSPDLMDVDLDDKSDDNTPRAEEAGNCQSRNVRPKSRRLGLQVTAEQAKGKTVQEIIALDAKLVKYSVGSLYDDWPEYAPENHVDKQTVLAEIKTRPTRKQMFGKPACYSRLAGSVGRTQMPAPLVESGPSKQSQRNATQWQIIDDGKENVKEFDSLEDFFGIPRHPLTILVDGKLAYRDGTRNADGELPRARTIYIL